MAEITEPSSKSYPQLGGGCGPLWCSPCVPPDNPWTRSTERNDRLPIPTTTAATLAQFKLQEELSPLRDVESPIKVVHRSGSCFEDYSTLETLGSGTYANVWKVIHNSTGEICAAKLLQPQSFAPEYFNRVLQMFVKEIKYLVLCQCPGVVQVKEIILGKEGWLLIQEFADDGTVWGDNVCASEYDAFLHFIQLAQAVMFLQDNNVVHRDLKPTNILRFRNKKLVIADFGWSEHSNNLSQFPSEWPGTLEINPPEILTLNGQLTDKIDNYAVGMNFLLFFSNLFVFRQKNLSVTQAAPWLLQSIRHRNGSQESMVVQPSAGPPLDL